MKKVAILLALTVSVVWIGLSAHPRKNNPAAQNNPTTQAKPAITVNNQVGAPVKVIDASASDAGIFRATLQFDDSGTWNAYALRWTADYGPGHKHTFVRTFDKAIGPDGSFTGATFARNAITLSKDTFLANDKNDIPLKLQKAEVEVLFLIKNDGSTWGDITADTVKLPNGEEMSPYLSIMALRKK